MAGVAVGCVVFGVVSTLLLGLAWKHRPQRCTRSAVTPAGRDDEQVSRARATSYNDEAICYAQTPCRYDRKQNGVAVGCRNEDGPYESMT